MELPSVLCDTTSQLDDCNLHTVLKFLISKHLGFHLISKNSIFVFVKVTNYKMEAVTNIEVMQSDDTIKSNVFHIIKKEIKILKLVLKHKLWLFCQLFSEILSCLSFKVNPLIFLWN